ncbi:MAG: hypothetical protein K5660_04210 [Paludibacteraceae bacterium]|nr:hypothetical protein [Paludibacteraceae bacterium]
MTIAIDFDGTIVTHAYPAIGKPIPFAIESLKMLQQVDHHQLILWSCREGALLQEAVDYCHERGLDFYAVNSNYPEEQQLNEDMPREVSSPRKLTADLFIDDRNLGGIPDWGVIYQMIHTGKQFQPVAVATETPKRKEGLLQRLFG